MRTREANLFILNKLRTVGAGAIAARYSYCTVEVMPNA